MHSLQLAFVITVWTTLLVRNSLAWRNYILILTDIKCNINPEYISHVSCTIDNTTTVHSASVDAQMIKKVTLFRFDFFVDLERPKREIISLYRGTDLNACDLLTANVTQPLLKMYKELTMKVGTWPEKCPIPADFHYHFINITLDSSYLPKFVPETNFKVSINFKDGKTSFWRLTTLGSIVYKKQNKDHLFRTQCQSIGQGAIKTNYAPVDVLEDGAYFELMHSLCLPTSIRRFLKIALK